MQQSLLIATGLLSRSAGVWGWGDEESLGFLASLTPLGGVVYAAAIFVMEWGVRMVFWALAQREKDIEKRRAEGEARGEARGEVRGKRQARVFCIGCWVVVHPNSPGRVAAALSFSHKTSILASPPPR